MFAAALALAGALQAPQSPPASRPEPLLPASRPYAAIRDLAPAPPRSIRLFVARHGESVGNRTKNDPKLSEAEKDKLTDDGRAQAKEIAAALQEIAGERVTRLLHSPAVRARETAEIVSSELASRPGLREVASFAPLRLGAPSEGESLAQFAERCRAGMTYVIHDAQAGSVLLVAHAETLSAFAAMAASRELRAVESVPNGAIVAFDVDTKGVLHCLGLFARPPSPR
ncbi:MAG TPA: phosphoglycerate mutase family protein [Planctomycetota bacterium]|nr:phosphoglycerate mutase family protein [Planctomycetota bacterium]